MSNRYRLRKEYPGSPKLGTILTHEELQYCNWDEYYQKVVEKDYEILSLIEGKFIYPCDKYSKDYINQLFNTLGINIHSVKRNDGEVFTVGDKTNGGTIKEFMLYTVNNGPKNIHIVYNHDLDNSNYPDFKNVQHLKQPLFTTEDGVDIFEGDVVTVVSLKDFKEGDCDGENDTPIEAYSITWENKIISSYNWNLRKDNFLQFSTKEKAKEYILMNKPCLSLNDIFKDVEEMRKGLKTFENSQLAKRFKKLVKQKLNK